MCAPQGLPREMLSRDTQMVWYASRQPPTSGMPLRFTCHTGPARCREGRTPAARLAEEAPARSQSCAVQGRSMHRSGENQVPDALPAIYI